MADWDVDRYRALLLLQARQLRFDPRLQRRFDSSDLVQETLLKAHEKRDQFRGRTEAERIKWLQEILTHTLADQVRRARAQKRDVALEQSLEAAVAESSARLDAVLPDNQPSPAENVERAERLMHLAAAIEQLPEDQRDVIILRDLMGQPVAQIGEALGRSAKSIAGLVLRARRKLRELLLSEPEA